MTLFKLALRAQRPGAAIVTIVAVLNLAAQIGGYSQLAGDAPAERAVFAAQMELLGKQLAYLLPIPLQLETNAGFVHWRAYGLLPTVYGTWALLAATGAGRGDEERGLVEQWLSAGASRTGYLASRIAAFLLYCAASCALLALAGGALSSAVGEPIPYGALLLESVPLFAVTACCYGIALLIAQVAGTRRSAAGIGAVILLALFSWNSAARVRVEPPPLAQLSPFWAFDRSTPLLRGGTLDLSSVVALLAAAAVLTAIAAAVFARRDLGAALLRARGSARVTHRPAAGALLRVPVLSLVAHQRAALLGWALGLAVLGAFLVSLTRSIVELLTTTASSPAIRLYFERAGITAYDTFVGVIWLSSSLLLLSIFAIVQVSGWTADDAEGRLDVMLSQPVSRTRVVLERLAALVLGGAVVIAVSGVAAYAAAQAADIPLDRGRFALASALEVVVVFAFGAVGAALAGWAPRLAIVLLGAVAFESYLLQQLVPMFGWPEWVRRLSLYELYGNPIVRDADLSGDALLLGVSVVATVIAVATMRRRDVGR